MYDLWKITVLGVTVSILNRYFGTYNWPRKVIFGPAPITSHPDVKKAMLVDHSYTERTAFSLHYSLQEKMLKVAGISADDYYPLMLQGSTSFIIEAVINRASPPNGKWLILSNGYFGSHIENTTRYSLKKFYTLRFPETTLVDPQKVDKHLQNNKNYTAVIIVHLETSTGALNDITTIGEIVKKHLPDAFYVVDAATSFGGIPINFTNVDFLIGCANKAIEGVPGIGVAYAKKTAMDKSKGNRYSFALDLGAQLEEFNRNTLPYEVMNAFHKALELLEEEGGVKQRAKRYKKNNQLLRQGMKDLGFQEYLPAKYTSYIINSYKYPSSNFNVGYFADRLETLGQIIYNTPLSEESPTIRLANMGRITEDDIKHLLSSIKTVLKEMGYAVPLPSQN